MSRWFTLAAGLVLAAGLGAVAQDPPPDAPKARTVKAPEGWKLVKPKDKYFAFFVPKDVVVEEFTEGALGAGGVAGKTLTYTGTLADRREYVVVHTTLSGRAAGEMKESDVFQALYEADKGKTGAAVSRPKEIAVGARTGQEYYVTGNGAVRRVVTVVVPGRALQLSVVADRRDKVTDKDSTTFLTSLLLQAVPKADGEKKAPPA
ncbi:MAG TPA: hypothetical protein VGF55_19745 [Gemmataceae bacterium]|jgi:hypothetical protein